MMLLHALLLAAATGPCDTSQNQMELTQCWSKQASDSIDRMRATYAKVTAGLRTLGLDPAPLIAAQNAWETANDKTCDFDYALYTPGTIAPMIEAECVDRMARARTTRLSALLTARQQGSKPVEKPASPTASGDLKRFHALLAKQDLSKEIFAALAVSDNAWTAYRDKACAFEGGSCLSELDEERIGDLKAGWIGEAFW